MWWSRCSRSSTVPKPFNRIRKRRGFASLPGMDGRRRRRDDGFRPLSAGENLRLDVTDDEVQELANVLNDEKLAKRVVNMRRTKHPYGTVPEMIMVDYLDSVGERYKYQAQLYGGWRAGGLVPDFVVSRGGRGRAILINGLYWHNIPGKRVKDAADKLRILGSIYEGEMIGDVVAVWENRLMSEDRRRTMELAIAGVELGQ